MNQQRGEHLAGGLFSTAFSAVNDLRKVEQTWFNFSTAFSAVNAATLTNTSISLFSTAFSAVN